MGVLVNVGVGVLVFVGVGVRVLVGVGVLVFVGVGVLVLVGVGGSVGGGLVGVGGAVVGVGSLDQEQPPVTTHIEHGSSSLQKPSFHELQSPLLPSTQSGTHLQYSYAGSHPGGSQTSPEIWPHQITPVQAANTGDFHKLTFDGDSS